MWKPLKNPSGESLLRGDVAPKTPERMGAHSVDETAQLLDNPENACRLRKSIAQLEAGLGKERELAE